MFSSAPEGPPQYRLVIKHSHAVVMKSSAVFSLLVCVVFRFTGGRIQCDLAKQTVASEAVPHSDPSCSEKQE